MKKIVFRQSITASELDIQFGKISLKRKKFYLGFLKKLERVYRGQGKDRVIVALCGPTGSGKSVLASVIEDLAGQMQLPFRLAVVAQDGFHYRNSYLKRKNLRIFKGRYDTYGAKKLQSLLKQFKK